MNQNIFSRRAGPALLASALGALILVSGCVSAANDTGLPGVTFVDDNLVASLNADLDQAARATNSAAGQLGFTRVRESRDALTDTIYVQSFANKLVELRLISTGENLTQATIRVGAFGDKALSLAILAKIKSNLSPAP